MLICCKALSVERVSCCTNIQVKTVCAFLFSPICFVYCSILYIYTSIYILYILDRPWIGRSQVNRSHFDLATGASTFAQLFSHPPGPTWSEVLRVLRPTLAQVSELEGKQKDVGLARSSSSWQTWRRRGVLTMFKHDELHPNSSWLALGFLGGFGFRVRGAGWNL